MIAFEGFKASESLTGLHREPVRCLLRASRPMKPTGASPSMIGSEDERLCKGLQTANCPKQMQTKTAYPNKHYDVCFFAVVFRFLFIFLRLSYGLIRLVRPGKALQSLTRPRKAL